LPARRKVPAGEPARPPAGPELAERYEQLRRSALAGEGDGQRLGLAVLRRQGLAAWAHAWDAISPAPLPPAPVPPPDGDASALVAVLVSMALARGRP
jgi:hypothetical protein